ncbi:hypothetical protein CRG98_033674 [Punica granatum]|uniref:Uncharacterized protein n=1 Tax=Punica granatum TaxID=22663 RepID=A0A2I0IPE8_PUNGR|nr:hypothetical protein CRG98_033674 [Punica granatum]
MVLNKAGKWSQVAHHIKLLLRRNKGAELREVLNSHSVQKPFTGRGYYRRGGRETGDEKLPPEVRRRFEHRENYGRAVGAASNLKLCHYKEETTITLHHRKASEGEGAGHRGREEPTTTNATPRWRGTGRAAATYRDILFTNSRPPQEHREIAEEWHRNVVERPANPTDGRKCRIYGGGGP